jgi:tetratricopeptide (TPR) repeat protein
LDPKNKNANNAKGLALMADKRYEEALAEFDMALKIDPKFSTASINRMHALLALDRQKEAIDVLLRL